MKVLQIQGGKKLHGTIEVPGSKNASLALLSSVVLAEGSSVFHNIPDITDIHHKLQLLKLFGIDSEWREGSLFIDCSNATHSKTEEVSEHPIRTSFYLLGPLVARTGKAILPTPGGCNIGTRPVDFHLKGLALLGVNVKLHKGFYIAEASELKGAEIYLDFPSPGATQHLMSTAVLAKGITVIKNAAIEPEVTTLADFLNRQGARIEGAGTSTITITGVQHLSGCEFRIPADRMQASTYLLAGAITQGDVTVKGVLPEDLNALSNKLKEAEAVVEEGPDWVRTSAQKPLKAVRIKTMPYPGFPTDIQQPTAALLAIASGTSIIEETIYESRIGHIAELNRMGAKIYQEGRTSIIEGVQELNGALVEASDLRAGAALCLAGLAAKGETVIKNVHLVDRGYENLEQNLQSLGAIINRFPITHLKKTSQSII